MINMHARWKWCWTKINHKEKRRIRVVIHVGCCGGVADDYEMCIAGYFSSTGWAE